MGGVWLSAGGLRKRIGGLFLDCESESSKLARIRLALFWCFCLSSLICSLALSSARRVSSCLRSLAWDLMNEVIAVADSSPPSALPVLSIRESTVCSSRSDWVRSRSCIVARDVTLSKEFTSEADDDYPSTASPSYWRLPLF